MFFIQFGWTAAVAVFFSLVVARMLTPMMAAYLLRAPKRRPTHEARWVGTYLSGRMVPAPPPAGSRRCHGLPRRRPGLAILPGTFIPADDDAQTQVTLTLPPGSKLGDTLARAERCRRLLRQNTRKAGLYGHRRREYGCRPIRTGGHWRQCAYGGADDQHDPPR
jgi:hypothetical protein